MFVGMTVLTVDAVNGGDHNAAINIKNRAVGQPVLKAKSLLSSSRIVLEAHTIIVSI